MNNIDNIKKFKPLKTVIVEYKINGSTYNSGEIGTINAPEDKRTLQRKQGMFVASGSVKSLKALVNTSTVNCIICYTDPGRSEFIESLLTEAVFNNKTVYIKNGILYNEFTPRQTLSVRKELRNRDKYLDKKQNQNDMLYLRDCMNNHRRIPEERKAKMLKFIKYYEMDIPTNEIEWVETFDNLAFYIRNKIAYQEPEYTEEELIKIDNYQMNRDYTYGYDINKYYICEECGELVLRGTEDTHLCYCDIAPERTNADRIINGDRR